MTNTEREIVIEFLSNKGLYKEYLEYKNKVSGVNKDSISKEQKERSIEVIQKLQDDYPLVFVHRPNPKVALKIGIKADLAFWASKNGYTDEDIDIALKLWCSGSRYKEALKEGKRYDLNGHETTKASMTNMELIARQLDVPLGAKFKSHNKIWKIEHTGLEVIVEVDGKPMWCPGSSMSLRAMLSKRWSIEKIEE